MYETILKQLAEQEGITEQLKAENQMLWVQRINNFANGAKYRCLVSPQRQIRVKVPKIPMMI